MKRTVVLLLVLCLFAFAGQAGEKRKISANVASVYAAEGNIHEGMIKFKEIVEAKTDGRISITVHPAGGLGGEREVVEGVSNGTIEMGAHGGMDIFLYMPQYEAFEEMFVIRDLDHLNKFWATLGQEVSKEIEDTKGIINVGTVPRGSRFITANKPIRHPDDLKGMKMRLPDHKFRIRYFESMGVLPTIVAFPELYMALKTGVVDSQENPPETIYNYKYYETQKYLIPTSHLYASNRYIVSKRWLNRLDAEDQQIILSSWKEATDYANELVPDPDAYYIDKLVNEKGMIMVEDLDRDAFMKAAQAIYPEFSGKWKPGFLERVQAIK